MSLEVTIKNVLEINKFNFNSGNIMEEKTTLQEVIELDKIENKDKSSMEITAELIKKRDELKKKIENNLSGDEYNNEDEEKDKSTDTEDKKDEDKKDNKEDDIDDLDNLEDITVESLNLIRKNANIEHFSSYVNYIKEKRELSKQYSNSYKHVSFEEVPIVYTKTTILESLHKLISTLQSYQETTRNILLSLKNALTSYTEQLVIYETYYEKEKISFNSVLVSDKDILSSLYINEDCVLNDSLRNLNKFLSSIINLNSLILKNSFESIIGAVSSIDFNKDDNNIQYKYKYILPGFNSVYLALNDYKDYISSNLNNFTIYSLKDMKIHNYMALSPISIISDKSYIYILENTNRIISSLSILGDNSSNIVSGIESLITDIKAKVYDIENDKITDFTSIGIDDIIKDGIKYKLTLEANIVSIELSNKFLISLFSVLKDTVDLAKDTAK